MKKLTFNSEPYIIENKNYSSIQFTIIFPFKYDEKYIGYNKLLKQLIMNTSYEYKTEKAYQKAYNEKMIIDQNVFTYSYNNNSFFEFNLIIPDPKKVKNYDIESAFKFFLDMIYKPNIENNGFNEYYFEREKKFIKENMSIKKKDIYYSSNQKFFKHTDGTGVLGNKLYDNIELLDNITPEGLFKYYKNIIKNSPILITYGDIDNSIKELFHKYIKNENQNIEFVKDYYQFLKPFNNIKVIEEQTDYYQSILFLGYKVKDMKEDDIIYLSYLEDIVSSNHLLFKNLRVKENLVYSIASIPAPKVGFYGIKTYIDISSKDKVIDTIQKTYDSLLNKEFLEECTNKMLANMECEQIRQLDNRTKKLTDFILNNFEFDFTLDELIYEYKNINIDKFYEFYKRITLDTIYFLRGEFNEK